MSTLTENEVLEKVSKIISEITEEERVLNLDDRLSDDIGLVSIGYVELVVELEEEFDIEFPDTLLTDNNLVTVKDVVDNVMALL